MDSTSEKSSADIQREIDEDRKRIETRIGAIQERMSPGQLVDEVVAYAKGSGGGEYVSNLGKALRENPLPVALMGVSLAWLIAKQGTTAPVKAGSTYDDDYPLYSAQGAVRRVGPPEEIGGARYSHFADDAGQRFKALTDDAGRRAGNFIDSSGKTYRGFSDASGKQITQISDEAGAMLDATAGWASDTWRQVKDTAGGIAQKVTDAMGSVSGSASTAGATLQDPSARLNEVILKQFRDQPLVGGALAFAVGAAIGAALPHTDTEDEVLGETADAVKANVTDQASGLVDQGKEIASDAYDKAVSIGSDVHDAAKDRIVDEVDHFKVRNPSP
jgi:ElaB/YqjD/DUF883 family membrane-anchored ribosome-binding protein